MHMMQQIVLFVVNDIRCCQIFVIKGSLQRVYTAIRHFKIASSILDI